MTEPDLLIYGDAADCTMAVLWSARIITGVVTVSLDAGPVSMTSTVSMPAVLSCWVCVADAYVRACVGDIELKLRGKIVPDLALDEIDCPIERARRDMLRHLPPCQVHTAGGVR